jgi:hypothetical protein
VRDQSNGGDKGVKGAESVEDPVLPPVGLVDLVPPAGNESFHVRHGRQAQWHSRHSALSSPAKSFRTHKSQIILSEKPKLKFTEREREREKALPSTRRSSRGERVTDGSSFFGSLLVWSFSPKLLRVSDGQVVVLLRSTSTTLRFLPLLPSLIIGFHY